MMPTITVSMSAHNAGRTIKNATKSVLSQKGVDLELIVVDDASTDNTAHILQSIVDSRMRWLRNSARKGAAHCHNLMLEQIRTPFVAYVGSMDYILPGAIRRLLDEIERSSTIGMVHCYDFEIGEHGEISRAAYDEVAQQVYFNNHKNSEYRNDLLSGRVNPEALPIYRREMLVKIGRVEENRGHGLYQAIALKMHDQGKIKVVPELLYAKRIAPEVPRILQHGITRNGSVASLRDRFSRPYGSSHFRVKRLIKKQLALALVKRQYEVWRYRIRAPKRFLKKSLWWPVYYNSYQRVGHFFAALPLASRRKKKERETSTGGQLAYYLGWFPVLSETFIQREVMALKQHRPSLRIFAHEPNGLPFFDDNARALVKQTHYLNSMDEDKLKSYKREFLLKHPLRYCKAAFLVFCQRHGAQKTYRADQSVFSNAVYLAGVMRESSIGHVHTPWADRSAFVALVAAKLLGIPFSLQARASDLHRKSSAYALSEKFDRAEFVITNTQYNAACIGSIKGPSASNNTYTIYNGIDLSRFNPPVREAKTRDPIRLLCVARLIEPKGLMYLLRACKLLQERGCSFTCEIIGEKVKPSGMNHYLALKKEHRDLGLEKQVVFVGPRSFECVLKKYEQADIFVLPCVICADGSRDITPNVLIEAMAMKLPVVSTNITGIPEIVEDGISGLLTGPGDARALYSAIVELVVDPDLCCRLGENARKRVEERFDINKNIRQFAKLFDTVVVNSQPSRS